MNKHFIIIIFFLVSIACNRNKQKNREWQPLFNGKDLTGWIAKFSGNELNKNYLNTFRVKDGVLKVSYDNYSEFENRYGHLFYQNPFSKYKLRLQYRFTGKKMADSPWWTAFNSGVMIHAQAPASMHAISDPDDENLDLLYHFPVSVECQLLAKPVNSSKPVSTANVCQIGTDIKIDGKKPKQRNIASTSKTYGPNQWVRLELVVLGDSIIHHIVEGDTVLSYTDIKTAKSGKSLSKGYIALQAESQPVEFKNIEIQFLE
jgi:hypothetical protein